MTGKESDIQLRTIHDLTEAHQWLFNQQRSGVIDAKNADALSTTLRGAKELLEIRKKLAKIGPF